MILQFKDYGILLNIVTICNPIVNRLLASEANKY